MTDQILIIFAGSISLLFGIGLIFAKADDAARKKDEKRVGPLSDHGMGGWYLLGQNKILKYFVISFYILFGLMFIIAGIRQL